MSKNLSKFIEENFNVKSELEGSEHIVYSFPVKGVKKDYPKLYQEILSSKKDRNRIDTTIQNVDCAASLYDDNINIESFN